MHGQALRQMLVCDPPFKNPRFAAVVHDPSCPRYELDDMFRLLGVAPCKLYDSYASRHAERSDGAMGGAGRSDWYEETKAAIEAKQEAQEDERRFHMSDVTMGNIFDYLSCTWQEGCACTFGTVALRNEKYRLSLEISR